MDAAGRRHGVRDGVLAVHVDDLDPAHAGQRRLERPARPGFNPVHQLDGPNVEGPDLRHQAGRVGAAGEEEGVHARGDHPRDLRDAVLGDGARAAGHRRDEADGVGAVLDGQPRLVGALDAADLDADVRRAGPQPLTRCGECAIVTLWPPTTRAPTTWREHWQDEADAAFLYRVLADVEPDADRRTHLPQARRGRGPPHGEVAGAPRGARATSVGAAAPTARARLLAWTARRFGPAILTRLLFREEGREVQGLPRALPRQRRGRRRRTPRSCWRRSRRSTPETLGTLAGQEGEPWHQAGSGGFLRNVVYGFNDGLTANFGLVAGVIGASVAPHVGGRLAASRGCWPTRSRWAPPATSPPRASRRCTTTRSRWRPRRSG